MVELKRKIRVYLSAPGDVQKEREIVHKVVSQVNMMISDNFKILLELVEWKTHVVPDMGRAQETINKQLEDYDIFIGILWKRFGTPTGKSESGTEEEFNIAYMNWNKFKRPYILYYFCQAAYPVPENLFEFEQIKNVIEFKQRLQQKALIQNYKTTEEFADLLRMHLVKLLQKWFKPSRESTHDYIADFTAYLKFLRQETMYIDIRGLVTGKGKVHQFLIDELYIPLRTRVAAWEGIEKRLNVD